MSVHPLHPNKVILLIFEGQDNLVYLAERLWKYFEQTNTPPVHVIYDSRNYTGRPTLNELRQTRMGQKHPNQGWLITVGAPNVYIRAIAVAFNYVTGSKFRIFDTVDQAIDFLVTDDRSLDEQALREEYQAITQTVS